MDISIKRNPIEVAMSMMDRNTRREYVRQYRKDCLNHPIHMKAMVLGEEQMGRVLGAWRSRTHLAVAWPSEHPDALLRLSINRVEIDDQTGKWLDGISWNDLYRMKNECGYADFDAVEVFPAVEKFINVANMRHLWIMTKRLPFTLEYIP